jgi:Putative zinc-finger
MRDPLGRTPTLKPVDQDRRTKSLEQLEECGPSHVAERMAAFIYQGLLRMTEPGKADRLTDRLAQVRAFRPGGEGTATRDCLDDGAIAAMVDGTLEAESRSVALAHLAACERCRKAVASVARALADPEVAREARAAERAGGSRVRFTRVAIGVAAAAAIVLFVWPRQLQEPLPHRAPPITSAPAPEAVWPVGQVAEVQSLRWTSVAGADRYRVTLFDAAGSVLFENDLVDTVIALPDSVLLTPGGTYWWKVDARLSFDRWATSKLIEFSIPNSPGQ